MGPRDGHPTPQAAVPLFRHFHSLQFYNDLATQAPQPKTWVETGTLA